MINKIDPIKLCMAAINMRYVGHPEEEVLDIYKAAVGNKVIARLVLKLMSSPNELQEEIYRKIKKAIKKIQENKQK